MKRTTSQDKILLLHTAIAVAHELSERRAGTAIHIRLPARPGTTRTDGWSATIGNLGKGRPRLQVWLDHFTGYTQRRFWFGFYTDRKDKIARIARNVARKLRPHRTITWDDAREKPYMALTSRLKRREFSQAILEKYPEEYLYGMYDPAPNDGSRKVNPHLCARAAAFFESVARTLPNARAEDADREVYPHFENRKKVAYHLRRERSRLLATERKIKDRYTCCVCGGRPEQLYGELGRRIVEAHHKVPLGQLKRKVITTIQDLVTVCPNCHRALHRMRGHTSDIANLRRRVQQRNKRN